MQRGQVLVPNSDLEAEAGKGGQGVAMQVPGAALVAPEAPSLLEGGSLQGPSLLSGLACPAVGWEDRGPKPDQQV